MDVEHVRPAQDANKVAAEQMKGLFSRVAHEEAAVPLFVFDTAMTP